ncbi:MAG: hypothetical protein ACRC3B_22665 [Bacteroidia bacterium]
MNTKVKLQSVSSIAFSIHEIAAELKKDGYEPDLLISKTSIRIDAGFKQQYISVKLKVRYVYKTGDEEQEVMTHTAELVFHVFEGFKETFVKQGNGFAVSSETMNGLIRFFAVTAIGASRGMLAVKAAGTIIENHPYKFMNIEKFMAFTQRTNAHIKVKKELKAAKKKLVKKK